MSVVWVTADLDVPARSGGELRSFHLLRALAAVTDVSLLLLNPAAHAAAVQAATGVRDVRQLDRWTDPVRKRARAARHQWPLDAAAVHDATAAAWVRERGAAGTVVAEHVQAAPYLDGTARGVLSLHNDDARLVAESPAASRLPGERRWNAATTRRLQDRAVRRAAVVVCVSEADRTTLGRPDAVVVPNGTELPDVVSRPPESGGPLFVGSMSYPPNEDAVRWWCREIRPLLPAGIPDLQVVGRAATCVLGASLPLEVAGDVPDVTPYLERAGTVVLPLRYGGGSRLKLLEAMAHGRPVISTRKGAEGFDVRDGEQLLLADTARAFAAAVERLHGDRALAERIAASGREFAARHTWRRLTADFTRAVLGDDQRP